MYADTRFGMIKNLENDRNFLYSMFRGLKPRQFLASDPEDSIIVEENQHVEEILF